jgi:ariadne-1
MSWNKERLIERYMDAPEDVKYEAGVMDDPSRPRVIEMTSKDDFTCEICYSSTDDLTPEQPSLSTLALGCGHRFCKDCYSEYMLRKVQEEGESRRVQCMEEKCKLVVDERTVGLLVPLNILDK